MAPYSEGRSMHRNILTALIDWNNSEKRKPLVLKGARQVGKTYIIKEFGNTHFPKVHYLNFERDPTLKNCFSGSLRPSDIIQELEIKLGRKIDPNKSLIVFDEVQECPSALTSLKYFCEELPDQALIAAGSLLGVTLSEQSYPVGKIDELEMYSMSFDEFLMGIGENKLADILINSKPELFKSLAAHEKLLKTLKWYFVTGGLPEIVQLFSDTRDDFMTCLAKVRRQQEILLNNYYADISKHSGKSNSMHITRVLQSIPAQLSREIDGSSGKFKFTGVVPKISKYSRLAASFDWLQAAGLIYKVPIIDHCEEPLQAQVKDSQFKLYLFDIGLLGALGNLSPESILNYDFGTQKGYFVENFALQELVLNAHKSIYCWRHNQSEIEFVVSGSEGVVPIEVKAGRYRRAKSLGVFESKYKPKDSYVMTSEIPRINSRKYYPHYFTSKIL
jgi:uncharacterized protein